MSERRILDPTLDVVFTMLFGAERNREILLAFLTAILRPTSPIEHVELLSRHPERQDLTDKEVVLDLRVRLQNGEQVDVEMQNQGTVAMRKRALYYWARLYAGDAERGTDYGSLRRCVVIVIANFRMLEGAQYHSVFRSTEATSGEILTEDHELHVLELPKLDTSLATNHEPRDVLWVKFLLARTERELEALAMQEPMLKRAKEALEQLSDDPEARLFAERRSAALRMYHVELTMTREEGRAEGRAEGRVEAEAIGEARALARIIKAELAARGIEMSEAQQGLVSSCTDLERLSAWWTRARVVERAEQLFEDVR
jgi:predicted transposase/invertase (TIGR01784 family)